jgi:transcriptional regulator with XRE-family HTH domain
VSARADDDPLIRAMGARIHQLRRARGLTLARLAAMSGLSHPFLSKLERGLAAPSMASLSQIARALGTSQIELLSGDAVPAPERPVPEVVRAGEGATGPYGLSQARLLAGNRHRFQPMECRGDNTDPGDYYVHAEDEFLHVIAGIVIVDMGEHGITRLEHGDSVYLSGGVSHRWSAADPGGFRMIIVKERPPHTGAEHPGTAQPF